MKLIKSKHNICEVNIKDIYFTHSKIYGRFSGCGKLVKDTLQDILDNKLNVNDLPMITVIVNDGIYYSLNNRRLWIFKQLYDLNRIETIIVRIKNSISNKHKKRYTIDRCSKQAKILYSKKNL